MRLSAAILCAFLSFSFIAAPTVEAAQKKPAAVKVVKKKEDSEEESCCCFGKEEG